MRIRDVVTNRDIAQRRKILALALEKERNRKVVCLGTKYNYENEEASIIKTPEFIKILVNEFEGPSFKRIKSRLIHITNRIQRIVVPDDELEPQKTFKN